MSKLFSLAVISVFLATASSQAAYQAYMVVKGQKQGNFKGAGRSKSSNLPIIKYTMSLGGGKKNPITVVIEAVDGQQFTTAAQNNENLTTVVIQIVSPTTTGKERIDETIKLTNANISKLTQSFDSKGAPTDTITFSYQKIEIIQGTGQTQGVNDWMAADKKI